MRITYAALGLALLALSGCPHQSKETACPSMATFPHVKLPLSQPLQANGSHDIVLEIDGKKQSCSFTISGLGPSVTKDIEGTSMVRSPSTRTNSTCEGLSASGITNQGWVPGFRINGTPKTISITMTQGDKMPVQASATLEYKPTELLGKGCGQTQVATLALAYDAQRKAPMTRKTFSPQQTYGGRINDTSKAHHVIRTPDELNALISSLPKLQISKGPRRPNPDPMTKGPAIDFAKNMVVVGVCKTFYCKVLMREYEISGDTMKVFISLPAEPKENEMLQRPIAGPSGEDAAGNYVGLVVPKFDGTVMFVEAPK